MGKLESYLVLRRCKFASIQIFHLAKWFFFYLFLMVLRFDCSILKKLTEKSMGSCSSIWRVGSQGSGCNKLFHGFHTSSGK